MNIADLGQRILDNVDRVMVGKRDVGRLVLVALLCEGHVLLDDVPGVGKTTLARAIARSMGGQFKRIQFTPDLLPSDVSGISYFNQKISEFEFRPGPIFTNILLADEINRATPRTQSALLEAMQERTVTVEGETRQLARPFLVVATQNPVELEGTFPLPEAQLDRFILRIAIGYPEAEEEEQILARFQSSDPLEDLEPVVEAEALQQAIGAVREIHCDPEVRQYIVSVVRATREHDAVELGVSPRGSLALFRASQAEAALDGRDYVEPDDVKRVAPAVLTHRVILGAEARLRGRSSEDIVREVLNAAEAPVEQLAG